MMKIYIYRLHIYGTYDSELKNEARDKQKV